LAIQIFLRDVYDSFYPSFASQPVVQHQITFGNLKDVYLAQSLRKGHL